MDVWFATDLDREGEAIAWHLADTLGVQIFDAKRVVFNAITKTEIARAFETPRAASTAARSTRSRPGGSWTGSWGIRYRRLLWKKVAGGLSAGRVQSVGGAPGR